MLDPTLVLYMLPGLAFSPTFAQNIPVVAQKVEKGAVRASYGRPRTALRASINPFLYFLVRVSNWYLAVGGTQLVRLADER